METVNSTDAVLGGTSAPTLEARKNVYVVMRRAVEYNDEGYYETEDGWVLVSVHRTMSSAATLLVDLQTNGPKYEGCGSYDFEQFTPEYKVEEMELLS